MRGGRVLRSVLGIEALSLDERGMKEYKELPTVCTPAFP